MSAICGIVHLGGAPVDAALVEEMAQAAAYRGPDGIRCWTEGNAGLAHLALHTTPESRGERQPLVSDHGELVVTADARIDNREELAARLHARGHLRDRNPADAALILAAYQCWGTACPEHLVGDFAFVVWDKGEQRALAARDWVGTRALYYRITPNGLQFATEAAQLLADPTWPVRLDEETVMKDLLMCGFGAQAESYYQGIASLEPSHRLIVDWGGSRLERYRDFDPGFTIRYRDDDEYAEHFSDLLRKAVRCRLRSAGPVGIFMSGGLDSTSVAAVAADELASADHGLAPGLQALNWSFSNFPASDETEHSRAVAAHCGLDYREIDMAPFPAFYDAGRRPPHRDEPYSSHLASFYTGSLETLSASGRPRVWMSGHPGDMLTGGHNPWHYLEFVKGLRFAALAREVRAHAGLYNLPLRRIANEFLFKPLFWQPMRQRLGLLIPNRKPRARPWVAQEITNRPDLAEWLYSRQSTHWVDVRHPHRPWPDAGKFWRYRLLHFPPEPRTSVWFGRMAAEFGAEVWNPWHDLRLAEFALAIPESQIVQGVNHKLLLRRSMRGLLPETVRKWRGARSGPGLAQEQAMRNPLPAVDDLLTRSRAAELGFVDQGALKRSLVELREGRRRWSIALWYVLSLERWLRAHSF